MKMAAVLLPAPAIPPRRYELRVSGYPPLFIAASHANNMPVSAKLTHDFNLKYKSYLLPCNSVESVGEVVFYIIHELCLRCDKKMWFNLKLTASEVRERQHGGVHER